MSNQQPFNDDLYFVEGLQPEPKKEEAPPDSGIRMESLEGLNNFLEGLKIGCWILIGIIVILIGIWGIFM